MSPVGVFLSLVTPQVNTWIDGELYLPERWFNAAYAEQRKALCIPEQLTFQKKPELGWQMIQRVQKRAIPFHAVVMDDLYGRNEEMRQRIDDAGIEYYDDVPVNTRVYLEPPTISYPLTTRGKPSKNPKVTGTAWEVQQLAPRLFWHTIRLRPNERGYLQADFARCRVWVRYGTTARQEWLLISKDAVQVTYSLSNAPEATHLKRWPGARPIAT